MTLKVLSYIDYHCSQDRISREMLGFLEQIIHYSKVEKACDQIGSIQKHFRTWTGHML